MLTLPILDKLWPLGDSRIRGLRAAIVTAAPRVFPAYGLTTDLLIAHAMAQFSQECGAGTAVEEDLNYAASGLLKTWPARFTPDQAAAFAHQPEKIANLVYGSRLGNQPGSNDGWTFRSRGGAQVTGRFGYVRLSARIGVDLVTQPDRVNAAETFLECAVAEFVLCGCVPFAAHDDVEGVTHHLNGGSIGLGGRRIWLAQWKSALASEAGAGCGTIWVQEVLNALGQEPPLAVDGQFGSHTSTALGAFQAKHDLPADGKVGPATLAALKAAASGFAAATLRSAA